MDNGVGQHRLGQLNLRHRLRRQGQGPASKDGLWRCVEKKH
jgi:hypothetical protein